MTNKKINGTKIIFLNTTGYLEVATFIAPVSRFRVEILFKGQILNIDANSYVLLSQKRKTK